MTPGEFIAKWSDTGLRERAGSQSHFIDLCALLGEKAPTDADKTGEWYAFEKGAMKTGGGDGWADVWKRGCFAWEYKSPGKDLNVALKQLQYYVRSLENPPLLIVSDMERIELHTNWTNTVQEVHTLSLPELADARRRQLLKKAFSETEVEELRPGKTREALTKEVAEEFVRLAQSLRERGHGAEKVAHFVNRMVFCMFAEDVDLLPGGLFKQMLQVSLDQPEAFAANAQALFAAMAKEGGKVGFQRIEWFNGGIFDDDTALPLTKADIKVALSAANRNWSNIDPSIMGTLFERGLDPGKRSQLGAHYTDPDKIMLIVNPVIVEPLTREWEEKRAAIEGRIEQSRKARSPAARTRAFNEATALKTEFLERLKNFRVLDPACGSGNFLYLALKELKNIEHRVNVECEQMGLPRGFSAVGPECVKGIEINPFAAELARVSVWIGEIQWMREHGFDASRNPILKPLKTIECRDALLNADGAEAAWPEADVIIGNPPFLGAKWMLETLGDDYTSRIRTRFKDRIDSTADLVTFWFDKARQQVLLEKARRVGLVATNMIRGNANRRVMEAIASNLSIVSAWSDEPWVIEGADVRVSVVCFARSYSGPSHLNGKVVRKIYADLSGSATNLTMARGIRQNQNVSVRGIERGGQFNVTGMIARTWLAAPRNPNGRPNSDVLRKFATVKDLLGRSRDIWIIDFSGMNIEEAALYELPFRYAQDNIQKKRENNREDRTANAWWLFRRSGETFQTLTLGLKRFIGTGLVTKFRFFVWLPREGTLPDTRIVAIARDDDTAFGVLSSQIHTAWTLNTCQFHGVGNDPIYTTGSCFETFPFPEGLTPDIPAAQYAGDARAKAIAAAAARLDALREAWLNPPDLVTRVPEVAPGYPDRLLPVDDKAAATLKKRTLTNLYNERPAWLDHAHRDLDAAVAAAYGWPADLIDDAILERLFKLNQARAS